MKCIWCKCFNGIFRYFSLSFSYLVELLGLPNPRIVFCVILPFLFTYIESDYKYTSCIWSHIGLIFRLLLLRSTGNSYCRSSSRMLYHNTYSGSTNCSKVSDLISRLGSISYFACSLINVLFFSFKFFPLILFYTDW